MINIIRHGKKVKKTFINTLRCPDCNSEKVEGRCFSDGTFYVCNVCNCLWENLDEPSENN